jgi:hypothetical protein
MCTNEMMKDSLIPYIMLKYVMKSHQNPFLSTTHYCEPDMYPRLQ